MRRIAIARFLCRLDGGPLCRVRLVHSYSDDACLDSRIVQVCGRHAQLELFDRLGAKPSMFMLGGSGGRLKILVVKTLGPAL